MNRILFATALASAGFVSTAMAGPLMAQDSAGPAARAQTRADALALADRRFDRLDTDRDGKLSPDELSNGRGAVPPPPRPEGAAPPPADSGPPPEERHARPGRFGPRMFARMDTDGDGFVSRDEYRAFAAERFDRLDANHDGRVDADEREAARDAMMGGRSGRGGADRGPGDSSPPAPGNPPSDTPSGQ